MHITPTSVKSPAITRWIMLCMLLVASMVLVGGITRLTESGLSIVEWKLLSGTLPPLSTEAWQQEFSAYQRTPEYLKVNQGMSLEDFKSIFWLEYIHRLLGRTTGLALILPFAFFALRRRMDSALTRRMGLACLLVAAQGAVGWLMVKSGLQNDPWVNPAKLALHLGIAFLIFTFLLWQVFAIRSEGREAQTHTASATMHGFSVAVCVMVILQVLLGALVAGNDAGLTFNTFPLMDGKFIPDGMWNDYPMWSNLFHNVTMVQFNHRIMAYLLTITIAAFCWKAARVAPSYVTLFYAIIACLIAQFLLGVFTLILVVPTSLAVAHQANAMLLYGFCLKAVHVLKPEKRAEAADPRSGLGKPSLVVS